MSRFGIQPARQFLTEERWSIPAAADKINVPPLHLRGVVSGRIAPSPVLRDRLPALLGRPLSELFTPEALASTYRPEMIGGGRRRADQAWPTSWDVR